jgi:hypothetical protein
LDYKGLTNAGTWFIGKLQTERDKNRVLEGLKGAILQSGAAQDKLDYDQLITRLDSRVFLMHNVHEKKPRVFHTRWVMSYLRGPLTKPQIQQLMQERQKKTPQPPKEKTPMHQPPPPSSQVYSQSPPILDPDITQYYLKPILDFQDIHNQGYYPIKAAKMVYQPALGYATIHFQNRKMSIEKSIHTAHLLWPDDSPTLDWEKAETLTLNQDQIHTTPVENFEKGPFYPSLPKPLADEKTLKKAAKDYQDWLYHNKTLHLKVHPDLEVFQQPREEEREYFHRVRQAARERRDHEVDELEEKYRKKLDKLDKKMRKLELDLADDQA